MKSDVVTEKIDFEDMVGSELLEYISFKDEFSNEAELAFHVFCDRYQRDMLEKAEIICSKFGYNETIALLAVECTFAKVWKKAHTFDINKCHSKNIDNAILFWMYKILSTQIYLFKNKNTCAEPTEEEDLSIIANVDELIETYVVGDAEKKKELREKLDIIEKAMSGLSEKHRIVYLTYKAYEAPGRNLPRSISKKLKEQLNLTQNSIRVYKMEANQHIANYLEKFHHCCPIKI